MLTDLNHTNPFCVCVWGGGDFLVYDFNYYIWKIQTGKKCFFYFCLEDAITNDLFNFQPALLVLVTDQLGVISVRRL
mgnify:CR=1 FL=1